MTISLVASRMANIPYAGIRQVFDQAERLAASGVRVIHFEIGRPDFDTPAHIKQAAAEALSRGFVHYTANAGLLQLREAIAATLARYKGVRYDPATEILVTAGGQEAMYLTLQAFLEPGDEVLVPDPGFGPFYSCVRLAGGVPVGVPLVAEDNFAPDLEAARHLLTSRTRAIIVNSPHNPTGGVLTSAQVEAICRFAHDHGLVVLSDEAYDHLVYEGLNFITPAALPEMRERTVIWGSLSKTYAMTGWRIGYLAAPPALVAAAVKIQQNVMLSLCSFAQAGAVAALTGPQDCVAAMVAEFDRRRRVMLDGIARSPGLTCPAVPKGAFYVFARHNVPGMTSGQVSNYLLDRAGVAVVPGTAFGSRGEGYLRFSYATSYEGCCEGMARVAKAMSELIAGK